MRIAWTIALIATVFGARSGSGQGDDAALIVTALTWLRGIQELGPAPVVAIDVSRTGQRSLLEGTYTPLEMIKLGDVATQLGAALTSRNQALHCTKADHTTCRLQQGITFLMSAAILEQTASVARVHVVWVKAMPEGFYPAQANSILLVEKHDGNWKVVKELIGEVG